MTLPMNIFQVMQRLPHRYPFLLIDRVIEVDLPNKRLKAVKNITINEPFSMDISRTAPSFRVC